VGAAVIGIGGRVAWQVAKGTGERTAEKEPAAPPPNKPQPRPAAKQAKTVDPRPEPVEPKKWTFETAHAEAVVIGEKFDLGEPKATAEQLKLLTAAERAEVQLVPDAPNLLDVPIAADVLVRTGMTARIDRLSRAVTKREPRFKDVARALWEPESGPDGIVLMMTRWGRIPLPWRAYIPEVVRLNTPALMMQPEVRDGILLLGGRKWLTR
jgi:hypothetical protein